MVGQRSGIALLMVLIALVVVLSSLAAGLGIAQVAAQHARLDRIALDMESLRADAESLLHAWCADQGGSISTPSAHPYQGRVILSDYWIGPSDPVLLSVVVWDALAGVPVAIASARVLADSIFPSAWRGGITLGADSDGVLNIMDSLDPAQGIQLWPEVSVEPCRHWSLTEMLPQTSPISVGSRDAVSVVPVAALCLALHSDGRINVRTASPDLLSNVLRQKRRSDVLSTLLEQRDQGEVPSIPLDFADPKDEIRLVAETDRWSALITIQIGSQVRRWWVICAGTDQGVATLQRHDVE